MFINDPEDAKACAMIEAKYGSILRALEAKVQQTLESAERNKKISSSEYCVASRNCTVRKVKKVNPASETTSKDSSRSLWSPKFIGRKHLIWSEDIDLDDWRDFLSEEGLAEADESRQYEAVCDLNASYLDDEKANLDVELPGRVLAISNLGLWYGHRTGYQELGTNLNSIFDVSGSEWSCDAYNVHMRYTHHDGTNYVEFRLVPDGVDSSRLLSAIYDGTVTNEMIRRYTRSLRPYVSAIYGWGGRQLSKMGSVA